MKLERKAIAKPWGSKAIPGYFGNYSDRRIGEIWFTPENSPVPDILAKYLFTSEKLSIQVHPSDSEAQARSLACGKEECWLILDAHEDARLGIGLTKQVSSERLKEAALSGEIEALLDWKPVKRGDLFYIPAGTVHSIGADIVLVEIQQNVDITYRLYDYGRPRELHLDDGIAVSRPVPYDMSGHKKIEFDRSQELVNGPYFTLDLICADDAAKNQNAPRLVLPIEGEAQTGGELISAGECAALKPGEQLSLTPDSRMLMACPR